MIMKVYEATIIMKVDAVGLPCALILTAPDVSVTCVKHPHETHSAVIKVKGQKGDVEHVWEGLMEQLCINATEEQLKAVEQGLDEFSTGMY